MPLSGLFSSPGGISCKGSSPGDGQLKQKFTHWLFKRRKKKITCPQNDADKIY